MVYQWSLRLRLGLHLFPFRIGLERGPILFSLLSAGMLENVNEQILRTRRIFRDPIANALHVVSLKDRISMIAKARSERVYFAWLNVVYAQFVNVVRRIRSADSREAERHRGATKKRYRHFHIAQVTTVTHRRR